MSAATSPYGKGEYDRLMQYGRDVLRAEAVFGVGSPQHDRAVAAWRAQQERLGVR